VIQASTDEFYCDLDALTIYYVLRFGLVCCFSKGFYREALWKPLSLWSVNNLAYCAVTFSVAGKTD